MITLCCTTFAGMSLLSLDAALYSLRRQDFSRVGAVIVFDNNSPVPEADVAAVVRDHNFPVPTSVRSVKHDDDNKTHAWSTNQVVFAAQTPWVFVTRADYLLEFSAVRRFSDVALKTPTTPRFVTSYAAWLQDDIAACDVTAWRHVGPAALGGMVVDHSAIDAGVWMFDRGMFRRIGGLDEQLSAWGHAQTEFQHRVYKAGVPFTCLSDVLFVHPRHAAERDIDLAHRQLAARGVDLKEMWERYEGVSPY